MFISCISAHSTVNKNISYHSPKSYQNRSFTYLKNRSLFDLSLYLVTHRSYNDEVFISKVLSAVRGGVSCVQIRDRHQDLDALIRTAKKLKYLLTPFKVPIIINDHVHIALAVEANGVHLGQQDMPYHTARKILGPNAIIGLSVDCWEDVIAAQDLDVDYLGVSQLFGSKYTKPDFKNSWELEGLKKIREFSRHRLVPIGGINTANMFSVCKLLKLGPEGDGVAMVGELWRARNPLFVAQKLRSIMRNVKIEKEVDHVV